MEIRVVCGLRFIEESEDIYNFNFEGFKLIKGTDSLDKKIFTQNFIEQVGFLSSKEFIEYPFFFLSTEGEKEDLPIITPKYHSLLFQLLNFTWIVKDNNFTVGNLYCFIPEADVLFFNSKAQLPSNSKGDYIESKLTRDNLEHAKKALYQYKQFSSSDKEIQMPVKEIGTRPIVIDSKYHYVDYNKNTRIERAFSFLTMARTNSFLPLKISLYMSLLECLFTTDRQEVTHKVCERVAIYLGGNYENKINNYTSVKKAYDIRSGFFHGQNIDKKQDSRINLSLHSEKIDSIIRKVMTKVLFEDFEIFNGSDEIRVGFFNKMIFK